MSRIGYALIELPDGVDLQVSDSVVSVKGPKGELKQNLDPAITVKVEDKVVTLERASELKDHKAKHGLYRSLINNMVIGVSEGYKKQLELVGIGYRAQLSGQKLDLVLGMSHNIILQLPKEIKAEVISERGKAPTISLESFDKQLLGQVAAKIKSLRKPEPYKGKGIRFVGEHIRRKAGKAASAK